MRSMSCFQALVHNQITSPRACPAHAAICVDTKVQISGPKPLSILAVLDTTSAIAHVQGSNGYDREDSGLRSALARLVARRLQRTGRPGTKYCDKGFIRAIHHAETIVSRLPDAADRVLCVDDTILEDAQWELVAQTAR